MIGELNIDGLSRAIVIPICVKFYPILLGIFMVVGIIIESSGAIASHHRNRNFCIIQSVRLC